MINRFKDKGPFVYGHDNNFSLELSKTGVVYWIYLSSFARAFFVDASGFDALDGRSLL